MKIEDLLAKGYKKYPKTREFTDCLYGKEIFLEGIRAFNIIFHHYPEIETCHESFEPQVQFNVRSEDKAHPCFNVELVFPELSIEEIEAFFIRLYQSMNCLAYGD